MILDLQEAAHFFARLGTITGGGLGERLPPTVRLTVQAIEHASI